LQLLRKVPNQINIACSGGPDSMALLDFLRRGKKRIEVIYFNHGTPHGNLAEKFLRDYCKDEKLSLNVQALDQLPQKKQSLEDFWSKQRNSYFKNLEGPVLTAHHLDDALEWWVFTSLRGDPKLIPYQNENIIRPLLLTKKENILNWCKNKKVPYVIDPSNKNSKFMRNLIRHELMDLALRVNPGLHKTIAKKYHALGA
jgi:tRNA(Ile)-lysidine synthase